MFARLRAFHHVTGHYPVSRKVRDLDTRMPCARGCTCSGICTAHSVHFSRVLARPIQ